MKEWEIWIEGYSITGNSAEASLIGKAFGETFEEACRNFEQPENIMRVWPMPNEDPILTHKGEKLKLDLNKDGSLRNGRPSIWACKLFDNEADARKSFG